MLMMGDNMQLNGLKKKRRCEAADSFRERERERVTAEVGNKKKTEAKQHSVNEPQPELDEATLATLSTSDSFKVKFYDTRVFLLLFCFLHAGEIENNIVKIAECVCVLAIAVDRVQ